MKLRRNLLLPLGLSTVLAPFAAPAATAATITKANNATSLNLPASWAGGVVPGVKDTALWNSTVTAANTTLLGADLAWRGVQILNPGGAVTINGTNILTLGTAGIDMSAATQNFTIGAGLALAGGQTWNVATGKNFALTGALTRSTGSTVNVDRSVNTGGVLANVPLANGIVGPWASIRSAGVSAGGSPEGDTYATVVDGAWVPYTGATQLTATTAWGGMPAGGSGTENFGITSSATFGSFGFARSANTVRYTGPGVARQPGNTANADLFTMNGFMNAGLGTFTFGTTGNVANDRPYNVLVGADLELVLSAMSAGIDFPNPIKNNPAGASAVTVTGRSTVTFGGVNLYTGLTTVAGGTLAVNAAGSINSSSGVVIRGADAKFLHTSSVASTVPVTVTRGTLDGTGTLGAVTVSDGTGGILAHGNGGTGTLNVTSLTFNGAATVNATLSGATAPIQVTGALVTTPANGKVALNINSSPLANGTYNVLGYGTFTGAASDFTANVVSGLSPRQSASLVLSGNNVAIQVAGDSPKWTGALNSDWTTFPLPSPKNWKLITSGTATDFLTNDNVLFDDTATGTTTVDIIDGNIAAGVVTFNNSTKNYRLVSSGFWSITAGSLVKNGTGTLTIENPNTYAGGTTFNAGRLNLSETNAIGTGLFTIGAGGAKVLDNTFMPIANTTNNAQRWEDDFTFLGTQDLDMGTGTVTLTGSQRTLTVQAGTFKVGNIVGPTTSFTKSGPGTLTLQPTAVSNIGGTLTVNAGRLNIGSQDFLATGLAGNGTIANGSTVTRWVIINGAVDYTFPGTLTDGDTGKLGFSKQGTVTATLSGNNSYTDQTTLNAGTLVAASPTALGMTRLIRFGNNSTLNFSHDVPSTHVPPITFASGTTMNLVSNRATPGEAVNHQLTTQTEGDGVGGGTINVTSGANVTSGTGRITFPQFRMSAGSVQTTVLNPTTANVTLGAVSKQNNAVAQTLELGGTSQDNLVTGAITNGTSTAVSLVKSGSSTWTLSASSTYTGNTTIGTANGAGVLRVTADSALGTGVVFFDASGGDPGPTSRLELSGGITLPNNFTLSQRNNASAQILNVSGNNTLSGGIDLTAGGNRANIQSDAGLLTLGGPILTSTGTARVLHLGGAGNGQATNVISNGLGSVSLVKEGTGTWTLTAANSYSGATSVNGGVLSLSQAYLADGAPVNVAGTAVLNLTHNGTDTVDRFLIDGVEQAAGTWGGLASSATHKTARITGTGILRATNGTAPTGGYASWAASFGLNPAGDGLPGTDKELDGFSNAAEYLLGGSPVSGSNNPKVYSLLADTSADAETALKELVLTIAVPQGTPAFPAGSPTSTVTFEGYGITVRGSTGLASFPVVVTPVDPVTTGLPPAPVQGGITYEYRSFSLNGSNGLAGRGFLQVFVTTP